MSLTYRAARGGDWPAIERLLQACDLPPAGARAHLDAFVVVEADGALSGCVGAEVYGDAALLRSLAVADGLRGRGVGRALASEIMARLRARGVAQVALLTTTAETFFARMGFAVVKRTDLPRAFETSEEFKGACPDSATAMLTRL